MQLGRALALAIIVAGAGAIAVTVLGGNRDDDIDVAAVVLADDPGAETNQPQTNESATNEPDANEPDANEEPLEPLPVLGTVDTLTGLDGWLNTEYTDFEQIRADHEVVVVQFWTFACRNCKNTLDAVAAIHEEYKDQGVAVVGVHSPEFAFEAEIPNIIEAADELGVVWPIALDTEKRNFHRWQEGRWGYWPRTYLIDSDGQIRQNERGDGLDGYRLLAENIQRLLDDEA
ncbi:MAG: redoxin domain-containing protein [Actinomycetota bacterium]